MGECESGGLRVDFDRRLKLEFHGSKVTSDDRGITVMNGPEFERELLRLLGMEFSGPNHPGLPERRRKLVSLFQSLDGPLTITYQARLLNVRDPLGREFRNRLHTAVRRQLLDILAGRPRKWSQDLNQELHDARLKRAVLAVLADNAINALDFRVGTFHITPALYREVRRSIEAGDITVSYKSGLTNIAYYNVVTNEIELGFRTRSLDSDALIVHEATHAGFDLKHQIFGLSSVLDMEAAGYIAQCLFVIAKNPTDIDTGVFRSSSNDRYRVHTENVLERARKIAADIYRQANDIDRRPHTRRTDRDWHHLESAIRQHPRYRDKVDQHSNLDGVGRDSPASP